MVTEGRFGLAGNSPRNGPGIEDVGFGLLIELPVTKFDCEIANHLHELSLLISVGIPSQTCRDGGGADGWCRIGWRR